VRIDSTNNFAGIDRTGKISYAVNGWRASPGSTRSKPGTSCSIYYVRPLLEIGLSRCTTDDVRFGVAPGLGIALPIRSGVAVVFSTRYDVPFSGGNFLGGEQSFQHWSLDFGVAYLK